MNPQRQPTVNTELDMHYQDMLYTDPEIDSDLPATYISEHFLVSSEESEGLELLAQEIPSTEFSEHSDALDFLAKNLPPFKLFEVYEEALESSSPGTVFADYIAHIHENPSLYRTFRGNNGTNEIDLSNPAVGLLYFGFDPEA